MHRIVDIGLSLAVAAFTCSGWLFAMQGPSGGHADGAHAITSPSNLLLYQRQLSDGQAHLLSDGLIGELLNPTTPLLWAYLITTWLTAAWLAMQFHQRLTPASTAPQKADYLKIRLKAPVLLLIGLLAAAIWPWLALQWPVAGFALVVTMFLTIMRAAVINHSKAEGQDGQYRGLGILGGWATVMFCMALGALLKDSLALNQLLSGLLALLICTLLALWVQLQMNRPTAYLATVLLGLAGLAVAVMEHSVPLASAAAISLVFVSLALIRGTT